MHIVDVCAFYSPAGGGVRTYVESKLAVLPTLGHRVTVVVPGKVAGIRNVASDATIATLPSPAFPLDRRYRYFDDEAALHRLLDRLDPDLVEASSPWSSAAMVGRWRGRAPRALVMHADPLSAYAYRWFGRVLDRRTIDRLFDPYWRHLRRLDEPFALAVCGNRGLTARMRAGGLSCARTLPIGVEPGRFDPSRRDEELRVDLLARCGLPQSATLLLAVGRLAPEKRLSLVCDAVTAVGARRPVGLVIVGDGPERGALTRRIGGNPHILLHQPVGRAELATMLASADALVHGCEAETSGLIVAEARASGLPLVVPDDGGAADQVVRGAGIAYVSADATSLVKAIEKLLAGLDGARAVAVREAGGVVTMDQHFARLMTLYERLTMPLADAA